MMICRFSMKKNVAILYTKRFEYIYIISKYGYLCNSKDAWDVLSSCYDFIKGNISGSELSKKIREFNGKYMIDYSIRELKENAEYNFPNWIKR